MCQRDGVVSGIEGKVTYGSAYLLGFLGRAPCFLCLAHVSWLLHVRMTRTGGGVKHTTRRCLFFLWYRTVQCYRTFQGRQHLSSNHRTSRYSVTPMTSLSLSVCLDVPRHDYLTSHELFYKTCIVSYCVYNCTSDIDSGLVDNKN